MTLAIKELKLSTTRLIGSAPVAVAAAACALSAPALEASPVDVAIPVLGLPPAWVLAWDGARVAGAPVEMPADAAARVEQTLAANRPGRVQPGLGGRGCGPGDAHELAPALLLLSGDAVWRRPPGGVRGASHARTLGDCVGRRPRTHPPPARRARVNGPRTNLINPSLTSIWSSRSQPDHSSTGEPFEDGDECFHEGVGHVHRGQGRPTSTVSDVTLLSRDATRHDEIEAGRDRSTR